MGVVYIVSLNGMSNAGGVERVVYYLNETFNASSMEVNIVDKDKIRSVFVIDLVIKIFSDTRVLFFLYPILVSLYLLINVRENDIVVAHGFNSPFYKSDILFIHGTMRGFFHGIKHRSGIGGYLLMFYECIAAKFSKVIVAVSHKAMEELEQFYNVQTDKVRVLNNCVDCDVFYPIKHVNYNDNKITVLFCGRLEVGKGLDSLIKISEQISSTEDMRLIIATNKADNIELFIGHKNTKIHIGLKIEQLNDFYNQGDIFFFPSLYEGFEMVTLEALSVGIPVLGNKVGAIKELCDAAFPGAYIIDPNACLISTLREIGSCYKGYSKRFEIHLRVKKEYDLAIYKKRLQEIVFSNINK